MSIQPLNFFVYKSIKKMFFILLFSSSFFYSNNIIVKNNGIDDVVAVYGTQSLVIKKNEKTIIKKIPQQIVFRSGGENILEFLNFLEPNEHLEISFKGGVAVSFEGDKKEIYEYVYYRLNRDSFSKIKEYQEAKKKSSNSLLVKSSELLLLDILQKVNLKEVVVRENDTEAVKLLKKIVKYNWLGAVQMSVDSIVFTNFKKEMLTYYNKKYVEADINNYTCYDLVSFYQYSFITELAKANKQLNLTLPKYEIVKESEDNEMMIFLPPKCQEHYFLMNYRYFKHRKDAKSIIYKDILLNDFKYNKKLLE